MKNELEYISIWLETTEEDVEYYLYKGSWRYCAAKNIPSLSDTDRRDLVFSIPVEQGEYRCRAADDIPSLSEKDRRELRGEE